MKTWRGTGLEDMRLGRVVGEIEVASIFLFYLSVFYFRRNINGIGEPEFEVKRLLEDAPVFPLICHHMLVIGVRQMRALHATTVTKRQKIILDHPPKKRRA
jgi:hypothetical protein